MRKATLRPRRRRIRLAAAALLAGCVAPAEDPVAVHLPVAQIGVSVENAAIEAWTLDGGAPAIVVIGGIHGDEPSSADLVARLRDRVARQPQAAGGRRVVFVPGANPDGLRRGTRENANGRDLNRNFPAPNFAPGRRSGRSATSEPETRALLDLLRREAPALVIAVHAPLGCVDPDGDATALAIAERLAARSGLPVRDLDSLPGSLGSYVSQTLGRPVITYELRERRPPPAEPRRHVDAIIAELRGFGGDS